MNNRFPINDVLVTSALLDPMCHHLEDIEDYLRVQRLLKVEYLAGEINRTFNLSEVPVPSASASNQANLATKTIG